MAKFPSEAVKAKFLARATKLHEDAKQLYIDAEKLFGDPRDMNNENVLPFFGGVMCDTMELQTAIEETEVERS